MRGKTIVARSGDPRVAGNRLTIDLAALVSNYRLLSKKSGAAKTAAVVKADAYGLGAGQVTPALSKAGCRHFFVATAQEGVVLRPLVFGAEIFVLNGCTNEAECAVMAEAHLIPVMQSREAIWLWAGFWSARGGRRPCAVMVDTGMNRLGLTVAEAIRFADENAREHTVTALLVMSHLACADEPAHPMNVQQLESFHAVALAFGDIESSIANSSGIFLGPDYHLDMTRPGIALYGGEPVTGAENPMQPVATFETRILQIRHARKGQTVSYGATCTLERDTVIAVAGAGYADGYPRSLSGSGVRLRDVAKPGGSGFVSGQIAPILGRVTMDMTMFDITDIPHGQVNTGDWIELFGPNIALDDAARSGGTVAYEMLTGCGRRAAKRYVESGHSA